MENKFSLQENKDFYNKHKKDLFQEKKILLNQTIWLKQIKDSRL
jgi:hypothetical protein